MNAWLRTVGLILTLALGILLVPLAADAQPGKVARIGFLSGGPPGDPYVEAFRQGLREIGYVEGQNIVVEYRHAEGKFDRLPALADELVRLKVDAIVAGGTPPILAAKPATSTIPIIMVTSQDPVSIGLVTSLARPGGNITGLTCFAPELSGKRLELLKEAVMGITRVGLLANPAEPSTPYDLTATEAAARSLGLQLQILNVRGPDDIASAFSAMTKEHVRALNTLPSVMLFSQRRQIAELAAKHQLAAMFDFREFVDAGGLMSYGPSLRDLFRRGASFVDKIVKGAKPSDLPVERPTRFELVINLKTAKALGLTIPQSVLIRADQVIE